MLHFSCCIISLSVKSTTTYSALKGYCFSIPITQSRATYDHYPQSADESAQKKLFAAFPWWCPGRGKNKPQLLPDLCVQRRHLLACRYKGIISRPTLHTSAQHVPFMLPTSPSGWKYVCTLFQGPADAYEGHVKFPWNIPIQRSRKSNA